MKLLYFLALLLAALGLAPPARAQDKTPPPIKFGQPDPADFEAKNFVADSGAAAVVLCDYGTSRFGSPAGDVRIVHDRVVRLKILKKAGYDYATVEIPLYHHENDAEKISNVRGFTYVRGADGKIAKTKLTEAGIFLEKRSDRVEVQKLTLPAVQEGAVVEYAYTVTSNLLGDCPDWTFQRDIPTRWSEYRTSIPLVWVYKILYRGYQPLDVNETSSGYVSLMLSNRVGPGGTIDAGSSSVSINTEQHRWVMRNAPPVREEAYVTTPDDYVARLDLELVGLQYPDEKYRDLTESWAKKTDTLLHHPEFGEALDHTAFLKPEAERLLTITDPVARATAARELVLRNVKYDGTPQLLASGPLKRAWEQHRGSSADVNLLLVAALRQAGLPAQPLLLSTRRHGRVSQEYPQLSQFNYTLALVELPGGRDLLLDATEPGLPATTLPLRCLNQAGHTVPPQAGEGRWVPLTPTARYVHYQDVKLQLDAAGALSGLVQEEYGGYAGLEARGRLAELGEKKYVGELASQHSSCEVPSYKFTGTDDISKPLTLSYALRQPAASAGAGAAELFISPLAGFADADNPFRLDERRFPVDLGVQQQETISLTLTLPPGYVAELPKPVTLALPEQGGRYVYAASSPVPGTVQLVSRLTLDKPLYSPQEYHALRELYRQMLAKQAEALVIKKQ